MRALILILGVLGCASHAFANCSPAPGEQKTACRSCGNLEQNPNRGFGLARNALLANKAMRRELQFKGSTEINLVNPPRSSPGVLFYRVNITDRSWRIVNTAAYSRAAIFHKELEAGFEASLRGGLASVGGFGSEFSWRQSMTRQFEQNISQAISFGSTPYLYVLEDQNGREFARRSIERNAGRVRLPVVGPSDLRADPRYRKLDCVKKDPRQRASKRRSSRGSNGGSSPPGTGAGGGGGGFYWSPPRFGRQNCRLEARGFNTVLFCR